MQGNLQQRGPSSWRIRVFVRRDEAGKKRYIERTVRGTKREAQRVMARLVTEVDEGRHVAAASSRFGEVLEQRGRVNGVTAELEDAERALPPGGFGLSSSSSPSSTISSQLVPCRVLVLGRSGRAEARLGCEPVLPAHPDVRKHSPYWDPQATAHQDDGQLAALDLLVGEPARDSKQVSGLVDAHSHAGLAGPESPAHLRLPQALAAADRRHA